jgi:hypothetical protein
MQHPSSSPGWRARSTAGLAAALFACASAACSTGASEPEAITRDAIAGGTLDVSHQDVFLLGWQKDRAGALCTATLIAPNLLLTARHCVSPNADEAEEIQCGDAVLGEPYPASSFFATNDPQPREGSPFFGASEVRVPASGVDTCGYDIALLILSQNVPAALSTPAVPRIDRDVVPGEPYTAVGYGVTESGHSNGSRMRLEGLSVACEPGSCGDGIESTEFLGETGICSGDSGGPALDRDGKVLGVVSRGGPDCSYPVYGSVTAWRDFIIQTASDAATLGGYEAPFWVTSGSSDPAPVVIGAGGAASEDSGMQGDVCSAASECQSGLICYEEPSADVAHCTARCSAAADCSNGLICKHVGDVSVCAKPTGSGDDDGGCSISSKTPPTSWSVWLAVLGAVGTTARRRFGARKR